MFDDAFSLNQKNILDLLEENKNCILLDLGCDDGTWTMQLAKKIKTKNIHGVEIVEKRKIEAEKKGIEVAKNDLNYAFPYPVNFFDVVHSNQVIEHLSDVENFVKEIFRILKPNGYVVISTENGSSWHNIFASILGWQIFSLTNITCISGGIGNPLAIHRGEVSDLKSWTHKTIFNFLGLIELFEAYGFVIDKVKGAGYYPLPALLGNLDKRHAHFLSVKFFKQ